MIRRFLQISLLLLISLSWGRAQLMGEDQRRLADGLYARGLYDLALVEYQKLIQAQPAPDDLDIIYYRAGESASSLDQAETARTYFLKAAEVGGTSVSSQRARYRMADDAYRKGKLEEAQQLLTGLIEEGVDASIKVPVRYTRAQILENRNQTREAVKVYQSLINDYPEESLSAYAALRVAALSGEGVEEKKNYYVQALKNPPSRDFEVEALWGLAGLESSAKNHQAAADQYWQLWEKFPDSTRVRTGMIYLAWAQLQADEAERSITLSNATSVERKQNDLDTWLYLDAVSLQKLGKSDEAVLKYQQLLKEVPDSRFRSLAVYEVAGQFAQKGEHEKVLAFSADLQQVPGNDVEALWLLAESARGAGDIPQAMQVYTRIAHQHPKHGRAADALYFKALLLVEKGDVPSASKALVDFQRRYPEDPRATPALEQAGDLLVKNGELKSGVDKWLEVLKLTPDGDPDLLFKTAMLQIRLEQVNQALMHLDQYIEKTKEESGRAKGSYWKAVLFEQKGEVAKAQQAFETALKGDHLPANLQSEARMRLGQSYTREGNPEKALDAFLPVLGSPREDSLSDSLLFWLLPVSKEVDDSEAGLKIASAMVKEGRKPATREIGYYTLAESYEAENKNGEAEAAWKAGLAFKSETLEAAQASLAYAQFLLDRKKYTAAFDQFNAATRLASSLEQGKLQAMGMMGIGQVRRAEKNWKEAAKYFMSVAVLFDDPELSPEALRLAADSFRNAGQEGKATSAEKELRTRYPSSTDPTP